MANQILNEFKSFTSLAQTGFKYNLRTFPDTLTGASFLFALLFQSPPLAALTSAIVILNCIYPTFTNFLADTVVGKSTNTAGGEQCSGRFRGLPGVTFENALRGTPTSTTAEYPSYYTMFLGFLIGYIGILPALYAKELEASPRRKASTTTGLVVLSLIVITGCVYRYLSECDSFIGIALGLGSGAVIGCVFLLFFAFISDRRLTNILAFPLIRQKAPDGKPIYVCERK